MVDWVAGGVEYSLNGTITSAKVNWAYPFDAAAQSPSGRYAALFQQLGTKGLIIEGDQFIREINRSFYCANSYQFPIVAFDSQQRSDLIAHCPTDYNRLEIEELVSGRILTDAGDRKPCDFFHSRLAVSPGGDWLMSAGWIWHPFETVSIYSIGQALAEPRTLDDVGSLRVSRSGEINSATFIDDRRVVMACNPDGECFDDDDVPLKPGRLGVFNLMHQEFESVVKVDEVVGEMLSLGRDLVVGLHEFPKLIDLNTGQTIARWEDVRTGRRNSCIYVSHDLPPPLALDRENHRFAVAGERGITVIQFDDVG